MPIYTEVQQSKARWYLTALNVVALTLGSTWLINDVRLTMDDPFSLICICVVGSLFYVLVTSSLLFQRLDIRIDHIGVHFRVPYTFAKWQHIPWTEIDRIYVREYALLGEYPKGIWGLRQGPGGFAFAPQYGLYGLQIEKASGGKYLLGTQRPEELKQFLMNWSASKPVFPA